MIYYSADEYEFGEYSAKAGDVIRLNIAFEMSLLTGTETPIDVGLVSVAIDVVAATFRTSIQLFPIV